MTGIDDYVLFEFTVAAHGSVVTPAVAEATSSQFSPSALIAISRWQFESVMDNGVAVPVLFQREVQFRTAH